MIDLRRVMLIAAVAGSLATGSARANEKFVVAGWEGESYPETGARFTHCAMSRHLGRDVLMMFSITREWGLYLSFFNPKGRIGKPGRFTITYRVDNGPVGSAEATIVDRTTLRFALPLTAETFRRFRMGYRLYVNTGDRWTPVPLSGTAAALERLRQCVVDRLDVEAGRRPRYRSRRHAARTGTRRQASRDVSASSSRTNAGGRGGTHASADDPASDSTRRLEAVTYVANLLARAGFRGYRILQRKELRTQAGKSWDVVWRTRASIGALSLYAEDDAKDMDALAAEVIVNGTNACKGTFRSGVKREPNSPVVRFFTQCDGDDGWHALYALVRGKDGKAYLVLSLGNGLSDKEDGGDLRAVDDRIVRAMTAKALE